MGGINWVRSNREMAYFWDQYGYVKRVADAAYGGTVEIVH
jgi:hypothetical protein